MIAWKLILCNVENAKPSESLKFGGGGTIKDNKMKCKEMTTWMPEIEKQNKCEQMENMVVTQKNVK